MGAPNLLRLGTARWTDGVYVAYGTDSGFTAKSLLVEAFDHYNGWPNQAVSPRIFGGIDGDGLDDIVGFGSTGATVALSQNTQPTGGDGPQTFTATAAEDTFHFTKATQCPAGGGDTIVGFDAASIHSCSPP